MKNHLVLAVLVLVPACSKDAAGGGQADAPAMSSAERVKQMDAAIETLQAKPEHQAAEVQLQHVLVAVVGGGVPGATHSGAEARERAAEIYARAVAGEDFDTLERNYSDDANHPGIYTLSAEPTSVQGVQARRRMVPAFGDVGWRLEVGEIGVAPHDPDVSPFGYHIIKRLR
jgi:parvulin-like peptidyl-prolyl isomerase